MIDISFLRKPLNLNVSGTEFLDWQNNTSFFDELKDLLTSSFDSKENRFDLTKGDRENISSIIKKHTDMYMTVAIDHSGNAGVDAGYISPGNILNMKDIEKWLDTKYSKLSEAFKDLKKDVIKGWCDLKTGRVCGDFKDINFTLYLNPNLPNSCFKKDWIEDHKEDVPGALAAFILHECGHVFAGLHFVSNTVLDNAIIQQTIKMTIEEKDPVKVSVILKDASTTLDLDLKNSPTPANAEETMIILTKARENRNLRRTLSLGVSEMSSEVFADAYAIRMGAGRQLLLGLTGFRRMTYTGLIIPGLLTASLIWLFLPIAFFPTFFTYLAITSIFVSLDRLVSAGYDTPYRRAKNILREHINRINNDKELDKSSKVKLIVDAKKMESIIEEEKPFLESTAVQRLLGWLVNGTDFRKNDFEHYTAELVSTTLSIHLNDI